MISYAYKLYKPPKNSGTPPPGSLQRTFPNVPAQGHLQDRQCVRLPGRCSSGSIIPKSPKIMAALMVYYESQLAG